MAATTFQQILSQFLEEKTPFSRGESAAKPEFKRQFTSYEPLFTWENKTAAGPRKASYPKNATDQKAKLSEEKAVAQAAKIVPTPSEPSWEIGKLSPEIQLQIAILTRMGANFEGKISISLLKKAHRKLARQLHPDIQGQNVPAEKFLQLQSIYEGLLKSLKALDPAA